MRRNDPFAFARIDEALQPRQGSGRFLSLDPVYDLERVMHKPQGWNRYSYVENNPINLADPNVNCVNVATCASASRPIGWAADWTRARAQRKPDGCQNHADVCDAAAVRIYLCSTSCDSSCPFLRRKMVSLT
jgi:hypothetical protein